MSSLEVLRAADPDALAALAAQRVAELMAQRAGGCQLALSGGSTPRLLHRELVKLPVAWARVELYWGDERGVPPDDAASNYRMAKETLLDHVDVPAGNVHRIEAERGAQAAAEHYAGVIGDRALDVVLLGMGDDGHTASLFPGTEGLRDRRGVLVTRSPLPPPERVSLALDVINRARVVLLLVAGASKAPRLRQAWDEWHADIAAATLPVAMVRPAELIWMVDDAAARELPQSSGKLPRRT